MRRKISTCTLRVLAAVAFLFPWNPAFPQIEPAPASRIVQPIDQVRMVRLKGNVPASALPQYDQGVVDPSFKLAHITLELKPSAQQQQDLDQLLKDQQDPSSTQYHKWFTPEQFAGRFGLSPSDIASITDWLTTQGFTVVYEARGRNYIAFDGTAAQVQSTFQTEIHRFTIGSEQHFANSSDPAIPAALADVVRAIGGLHDFLPKPMLKDVAVPSDPSISPATSQVLTMTPSLFASLYDVTPLYNAGFSGAGQTIVIVGQSEPEFADVAKFRSRFNLPASVPQAILGGTDPGTQSITSGVVREQNLDLEWAGAVAPGASLIYVYSTSADGALAYAIDNDLAPVMSESFGLCEAEGNPATLESHLQAGASMGITVLVSSGDSGAAACDPDFTRGIIATKGLAVSYPASSPEVTAVGGTAFTQTSSAGYVPESAWNDTAFLGSSGIGLAAGGGGASAVFPKPAWQIALGVPNDNSRDVPDVALASSPVVDPYSTTNNGQIILEGGTSASAPAMAGIVALLNQYLVANGTISAPGLGVINPILYQFSQTSPGSFHDITIGGNQVPCQLGTPNCTNGMIGYPAATGYDQATGLGSLDVNNLALYWSSAPFIRFSATQLTFASQIAGSTSAPQTVTLTNTGNSPLGIAGVTASGDFAQTNTCGTSIAVAGTCTISVTYKPTVLGPETGSVSIAEATPGTPLNVNLSGTAISAVSLSPASLAFGQQIVNTTSAPQTVTLTNAGPTTLTVYSIGIGLPFYETNNCGTSVAPGGSCTISVTFKPVSPYPQAQSLGINDSAIGSQQIVALTGTGFSTVKLSPSLLTFPPQIAGTTSAAQTATLTNVGTTPLAITSIVAMDDYAQTNNCGTSIASAGNCTITVTFTPSTVGGRDGAVSITDNATDSPQTLGLTGSGASGVNLSATSLNFQDQAVTTAGAAQTVTLTNIAAVPLIVTSIVAGGPGGSNFTETNTCGSTVSSGGICMIAVIFKPLQIGSTGLAQLLITDNAIGSPQVVLLNGTGISAVGLSSGTLYFNNQEMSTTSAPQTVTLTNRGGVPLAIAGISLTGSNSALFALTQNCPATLAVGSTCAITATFEPLSIGGFSAAITLTDSASDSPQTIALGGTGLDFSLSSASSGSATAIVAAGQTAAYSLQFSQTGGSGNWYITLDCSGAPSGATCSVSPSQGNILGPPSSQVSIPVTVTVTTTAHGAIPGGLRSRRLIPPVSMVSFEGFVLILLIAGCSVSARPAQRIRAWIRTATLMACAVIFLAACGGGGTGGSSGSNLLSGTPAGTYSLTVTVHQGTANRSTVLTLVVN